MTYDQWKTTNPADRELGSQRARRGDPREWHVASDADGFFVEDDYGEDMFDRRFSSVEAAEQEIKRAIDNWEPPDPPGWEGGFADNH